MAKSKDKENGRYKIYAFMVNPHTLILVSQDGAKLAHMEVPGENEAKEKLTNEQLNQDIILSIKRSDFLTIWVDDPAGDPDVIEACKKMEHGQADEMLADAVNDAAAPTATDAAPQEEQTAAATPEIKDIRTPGLIFQILHEGVWVNAPGSIFKTGDVCRFFPEQGEPDEKEWVLTADPELITEEPPDYLIRIIPKDAAVPAEPLADTPAEPQFKATEKTKVIDVECPTTHSEEKIKKLVRGLQSLKAEAQADAADWRERIKTQEKALFEACNGKSFTEMECRVEEDWEAGTRRYIRPDNGEVALEQQIPYEERQLHMGLVMPTPVEPGTEATPEAPAEDNATNVTETPAEGVLSFDPEPATDETKPAENETTEPETADFPPPDETAEPVQEPAV